MSATATEDDSSVAQTSEQHVGRGIESGNVPKTSSVPEGRSSPSR